MKTDLSKLAERQQKASEKTAAEIEVVAAALTAAAKALRKGRRRPKGSA